MEPTLVEAAAVWPGSEVGRLVALAGEGCRVEQLTAAPESAWPALLATGRTEPSAAALMTYLDRFDGLGRVAAALLGRRRLPGRRLTDPAGRVRLAAALLAMPGRAEDRVRLAADLSPGVLPVSLLPVESGPLAGLLIGAELAPDDADTFVALVPDWASRESAIAASGGFAGFVDPQVLPGSELPRFFASGLDGPVKQAVLDRLEEWAATAGSVGFAAAGDWALRAQVAVPVDRLMVLAEGEAPAAVLVPLLARLDPPLPQLLTLLRRLGGDHARIAAPGTGSVLLPGDAAYTAVLQRLGDAGRIGKVKPQSGRLRVWLRPTAA